MKSDLTCPVEVVSVLIRSEEAQAQSDAQQLEGQTVPEASRGQIVCEIEFANLSEKETSSIQMNLICFDEDNQRLGGRLVRSGANGEPRGHFTGLFMPEHVDGASRVQASVEKVWFKDGTLWRREERNVREYTPNQLPEGRELDRLRSVAGADAAGYAREDDIVWMCVCGRANRTSDDVCMRCRRERVQVLQDYCFAAIDSTVGEKERTLEQQTRDNLRKSSEQTVRHMTQEKKKQNRRKRRLTGVITALALIAIALAVLRWGLPYGANLYAQHQFDQGLAADARDLFAWVDSHWPGFGDAGNRAQQAEQVIIEGLIASNTDETLEAAADRALKLDTQDAASLHEQAVIARAQLAKDAGDTHKAEELLGGLTQSETAQEMRLALIYEVADAAKETLDYETAIARFTELGEYKDAAAQRDACIYQYGRQLMRAGQYVLATDQFMQVTGESDAIALIRQCRYAIAMEAQENGDYISAAQAFESLGVYEEAETRAKYCRYTAGMNALEYGVLDVAAEQLAAAGDYEDAAQRFADTAFTLGFTALEAENYLEAIRWLEQLEREGEVADALNRAVYAYAEQLEAEGSREEAALQFGSLGGYEDAQSRANALIYAVALEEMETSPEAALGRFEGLGDYEDAPEMAEACTYALAQNHHQEGQYEAALMLFDQLGDYEDAASQARRSRYAWAEQLFEAGTYDLAAQQYEACGAYLHAEERAMRSKYESALLMQEAGQYQEAALAFGELGSYEDAKLRVTQCEDAWLQKIYNNAWLDMDLGDYDSVITALSDIWQEPLPQRYQDLANMYENACLYRSEELIDMGRPLDALPILESISENKTAQKRLDAYVYRIIGRWKDTRGREYVFRRDGTCSIDGVEMYFGGHNYDIRLGTEPYPTQAAYSVVSLKKGTLTLRDKETNKDARLSYLGEPDQVSPESGAGQSNDQEP